MEPHFYSAKAREREFFAVDVINKDGEVMGKFIGLGPASMKADDIVVVPYGASRPFILRPCHDPHGSYSFVGEAIVPTIMHGEWIRHDDEDDFPVKQFNLI
ncbi:hypothetical protein MRB53_041672 [Persea americana]|nr:hypothetical protein MRB53_041672 [Persea americana]